MQVDVRLFAMLRQRAGSDRVTLELPDAATVDDALAALADVTGDVPCVLAVNREYADGARTLHAGDELALIPPVSGGDDDAVHVRITDEPLSLDALAQRVRDPRAGGLVHFEGVTRECTYLDYEAYVEMAEPQMRRIVEAAVQRHGLCRAAAEHRIGRVGLSEPSVIVAVSAPHRPEAFAGAREIIDELKANAPIWKAEEGEWVSGTVPPAR